VVEVVPNTQSYVTFFGFFHQHFFPIILKSKTMPGERGLDILVTGGSGFLGRAVVARLLKQHPEWRVSILDLQPPPPHLHNQIAQFIQADISDAESVNNAFVEYSPDLVVHTAGIVPARKDRYSTSPKQWEKVKRINYDGTRHVLDASMASGCRMFVYTSSCTVVIDDLDHDYFGMDENTPIGNATLHYGKSKGMAEQYVLHPKHAEAGLVACALRPATILGPEDTAVMGLVYDLIGKGETNFIIGDGDNFYDWMYIDNAAQAHVMAVENLLSSKTAAGHAMFISNQEPVYFCRYAWCGMMAVLLTYDRGCFPIHLGTVRPRTEMAHPHTDFPSMVRCVSV
jgi:sterol-4alpha-carboxylate 3-dehydrogenase (decarboxylating)